MKKEIQNLPTGANWKEVLLEIYNFAPHTYNESHQIAFNEDNHILAKKLSITGYELNLAISFLIENKLIEELKEKTPLNHEKINPYWINPIKLTKKGFEIALKLDEKKTEVNISKSIAVFAGITAIIGLQDLFNLFFSIIDSAMISLLLIALLIIIAFYKNKLSSILKRKSFSQKINSERWAI